MKIDGMTTTYGIIGWPVKHSLSPLFQTRFLDQNSINAVYLPFAVPPELLSQAVEGLWALGVQGFNVTVPHKERIFQMVEADDDACRIGAVNTVRRGKNGWQATNTDWRGFKAVIEGLGIAIDAVYRPDGKTAFSEATHDAGRLCVDGLPMLIAQGAAAFTWWHGCDIPNCNQTLIQMQTSLGRKITGLPGWGRSG